MLMAPRHLAQERIAQDQGEAHLFYGQRPGGKFAGMGAL